ncbi:MAG TPA: hypothetical protein VMS17_31795 [Gemmataceae bacterium]|nr:hypothetical protein [Gemmataceae bacterium]
MATKSPEESGSAVSASARPPLRSASEPPTAADFKERFGDDLLQVLDVTTWRPGGDLAQEYQRIEREVREAKTQEDEYQRCIRTEVFPKLVDPASAPGCGVFAANMDILRLIHRGLLFNGGVEACDGTVEVHATLPLTSYQIGVSLVSYAGDQGTWQQRLYRRDLRQRGPVDLNQVLELLRRRDQRAALNHGTPSDQLGELARKAVMDYAERAILLRQSKAVWRMGHGNPITYDLLTGADILELMVAATTMMRELIEGYRRFVFVASEPRELLALTIGQALPPLHYAIVGNLAPRLEGWFQQRRFTLESADELLWDGEPLAAPEWIPRFIERVASQVVVGLYRASVLAPAQLFYAHADYAHIAAHIVLADSMFQVERGFPLLIDLADHVCHSVFGGSLRHLTATAYAAAGAPWRYFSERMTRHD